MVKPASFTTLVIGISLLISFAMSCRVVPEWSEEYCGWCWFYWGGVCALSMKLAPYLTPATCVEWAAGCIKCHVQPGKRSFFTGLHP